MARSRAHRRAALGDVRYELYGVDAQGAVQTVRNQVRWTQGAAMVAAGRWGAVADDGGHLVGFQILPFKLDPSVGSDPSLAAITPVEMEQYAGLHGRGAQQHARRKVEEWPRMHGDRAVRVYPKDGDAA